MAHAVKKKVEVVRTPEVSQGVAAAKAKALAQFNEIEAHIEAAGVLKDKLDEQIEARREQLTEMGYVYDVASTLATLREVKVAEKADAAAAKSLKQQERAREEAEYLYERNRTRKLEQESYEDDLRSFRKTRMADLEGREVALGDMEADLKDALAEVVIREEAADAKVAAAESALPIALAAEQQRLEHEIEARYRDEVAGLKSRLGLFEAERTLWSAKIEGDGREITRLQGEVSTLQAQLSEIAREAVSSNNHKAAVESATRMAAAQAGAGGRK